MQDAEFQRFLEESKARNRHNCYSYTDTPTSYELSFTEEERKGIDEVIRSITPRDRYMPTRKVKENTLKTFLMSFDSYEQLPSKIEDVIIGTCRSHGRDNYHRKIFYILRNLDAISSSTVASYLQRQATRLGYEVPSDGYCANLTTICTKVITAINHHAEVGNIDITTSEPDFEFDPYLISEGF
ncbi:hypothetical protein BEH75_06680 [Citrobacter freundii]|uniref:hypothetical protein n=1 Tax=Citrobacter freundii TaxID=546 RepID=UPI0008FD937C|nr:hypothetical protein [Citrobacter freundii]MDH0770840.1 hypothetical protein [Citrobacter freundii]MDH1811710.1 hypothetical protein [Citrobacter freundii]MDH1964608.1 hypothetical protein [Citrobacter freundii]OIZ53554.1 hypothetical protein BEH75_06680 [Citrobacter freundii]HBZ8817610.1 hypothetical protein [Citrobacter freundii]